MNKKIALFVLLTFLGILGNIYNIEMFFGVNQIFGSIFVLLVVWFYGPYWGVLCAALVHSYTIYLWGHPYAFIGFVLEAFVVGVLIRWRISNLFVADLIYWIFIGVWLVPLFYGSIMGMHEVPVKLIMLKQPANGILNALIASVITIAIAKTALTIPLHSKTVNLKYLLFTIIMTCVSLALYSSANMISHNVLERFQKIAVQNLQKQSRHILYEQSILLDNYYREFLHIVSHNIPDENNQLNLNKSYQLQALWMINKDKLSLLANQGGLVSADIKPDLVSNQNLTCGNSPRLIATNAQIYLAAKYLDNCFIGLIEKHKLIDLFISHADLVGINILIFNDNQLFASNLSRQDAKKVIDEYRSGQKNPVYGQIFHLLPPGDMPKMLRWTRSHFIYDLPFQQSVSYQMVILFPFSPYIDSLQQIHIFTFAVMMAVIIFTAFISIFISKLVLTSFEDLSTITQDIPDKVQRNQTIHWPVSYIEEVRHLTKNFAKVSDTLSIIFYDGEQNQHKLYEEIKVRIAKEKELALAIKQADKANRAKSEFLASMSHELRTPLNAVLGFAQLFQLDKTLTEQQAANANQIHDSGSYLLSLVNDLLDLSSIEAGRLTLNQSRFELKQLLDECYQISKDMAKKENVQFHYTSENLLELEIKTDYVRLKQILLNLLSNAVKYHRDERPQVWLSYSINNTMLEISVKDNGTGIEKDQQQNMFESFNRVGAENSYVEGSGIGLFVSMKLIQLMGGSIKVESSPGIGSTFCVCLPLKEE